MDNVDSNKTIQKSKSNFKFRIEEAILILLLTLSLVGVGLTNFSPTDGWWYWMAMIFIFAISAIIIGFMQTKERSHLLRDLLGVQTLHWFGSMGIVVATFSLLNEGILDEQATGLVILLILALATFLDGIRIGWRFSMVGIFLGLTAVIVAHIEEYMLIILILAVSIAIFTIYMDKAKMKNS